MATLHLPLKEIWYRMIESGIKKEEYRANTPYWFKRLFKDLGNAQSGEPVFWDKVEFSLGYPKKDDRSRRMLYEIKSIDFGKGKKEWGAPDEECFIIKIGKRL